MAVTRPADSYPLWISACRSLRQASTPSRGGLLQSFVVARVCRAFTMPALRAELRGMRSYWALDVFPHGSNLAMEDDVSDVAGVCNVAFEDLPRPIEAVHPHCGVAVEGVAIVGLGLRSRNKLDDVEAVTRFCGTVSAVEKA